MSGLFQRIARRPDPSDGSSEPPEGDAPTQQLPAQELTAPAAETPDATAPAPADTVESSAVTPDVSEAPTTVQPPVVADAPTTVVPPTSPTAPPAEPDAPVAETTAAPAEAPARRPGFRERGRMRRRLRYLRKLRELQVRDLGGLAFDLRRFERKRDDLIAQKIDLIRACDDELRALEIALGERRDVRDVREPGIGGTCPRCFALHGSVDRFCATCGAALGGAVQGPAQIASPPSAPPPAQPPAPPADAGGPAQ